MSLDTDAVWIWFPDPRAVHRAGITYITWCTRTHVEIGAFDHDALTWTVFQLGELSEVDDHANPAMLVRPDGRLLVAWCQHGGPLHRRISTSPGDVTSWGSDLVIDGGVNHSYANLIYLAAEDTYYLHARRHPLPFAQEFFTSTDGGDTWSGPTELVTGSDPDLNRPYTKFAVSSDRFDVCVTSSHPETTDDNSLYHFYYDGAWRSSAGVDLGSPPFVVSDFTQVWDGDDPNPDAWNWDISPGPNPAIVFATFPTDEDHRYQYARWDGSAWQVNEIVAAGGSVDESGNDPNYSGGIALDHANPSMVYLSRQVGAQAWAIERWVTSDGGASWNQPEVLTPGATTKHFRPVVPRGGGPVEVVWIFGTYHSFTSFDTELATFPELTPGVAPEPEDPGGLPQVAQAQIRTRLTWLSCNLSDGAVITELPDLQGDEVSRVIGEYTSANLALPIPAVGGKDLELAQRAQLAIQSTQPPRTKIVAVVNDVPAWEGIPLPRDLGTDAKIPLGCVSMEGYLRHVYITDHTFDEQDVALIADGILRDAVTTPHGPGIALVIDAPNIGTIASRSYLDIDNQTVYAGLQELMKAGLMEWTLAPDWRSGFAYRIVDTIARVRGQLGSGSEPTAVFQSATFSSQGASDARYAVKEDYGDDRYANVVRLYGAGEGDDQLRSAPAIDQAQLDSGVPAWELRDSAPQNVEQQALLDLHAERRLDRVRDGAHTLEITARWDAPGARLGVDWDLGDLVRHELRGHAHPGGLNGVKRAIGFALSIQRGTIRPILQDEEA